VLLVCVEPVRLLAVELTWALQSLHAALYESFDYRIAEAIADSLIDETESSLRASLEERRLDHEFAHIASMAFYAKGLVLRDRSDVAAEVPLAKARELAQALDDAQATRAIQQAVFTARLNRGEINGARQAFVSMPAELGGRDAVDGVRRGYARLLERRGRYAPALAILNDLIDDATEPTSAASVLTQRARLQARLAHCAMPLARLALLRSAFDDLQRSEDLLALGANELFAVVTDASWGLALHEAGDIEDAETQSRIVTQRLTRMGIRNVWSESLAWRLRRAPGERDTLSAAWARSLRRRGWSSAVAYHELAKGLELLLLRAAEWRGSGVQARGPLHGKRLYDAARANLRRHDIEIDLAFSAGFAESALRTLRNEAAHRVAPRGDFAAGLIALEAAVIRLEELLPEDLIRAACVDWQR
jgi:hypothetical protein